MEKTTLNTLLSLAEKRLKGLGYQLENVDSFSLEFDISEVINLVLDETALEEVPARLHQQMINLAVANFLSSRVFNGDIDDINAEKAVKSLSEGGRSISFAVDAPIGERFEKLVNQKRAQVFDTLGAHRRMRW